MLALGVVPQWNWGSCLQSSPLAVWKYFAACADPVTARDHFCICIFYQIKNRSKLERLDQRPHSFSLTRALEFGGEHVALTSLRRIHQDPCASLHLKISQSNLTCLQKSPAMAVLEPYLSVQVATSDHFRTLARPPILNLTSVFCKHFLTG